MSRPILVALLVLSSCLAHAQAVAPAYVPAPAVPAYTPGFSPGTPPAPVYTPPGTGLPMPGQPGSQAQPVPRSPNKRVLPVSNEPGLWAADGVPRASDGHTPPLFGFVFPHPPGDLSAAVGALMDKCVAGMFDAAKKAGTLALIEALPKDVRACISARALAHCADSTWDPIGKAMLNEDYRHDEANAATWQAAEILVQIGRNNIAHHCRRAGFTDDLWKVLEDNANLLEQVKAQWKKAEQTRKPGRFPN